MKSLMKFTKGLDRKCTASILKMRNRPFFCDSIDKSPVRKESETDNGEKEPDPEKNHPEDLLTQLDYTIQTGRPEETRKDNP